MPVVTITMAKGRSYEQKKQLTDQIAVAVKNVLGVPIERVTIFVHELEKENISIAGALLSRNRRRQVPDQREAGKRLGDGPAGKNDPAQACSRLRRIVI